MDMMVLVLWVLILALIGFVLPQAVGALPLLVKSWRQKVAAPLVGSFICGAVTLVIGVAWLRWIDRGIDPQSLEHGCGLLNGFFLLGFAVLALFNAVMAIHLQGIVWWRVNRKEESHA